MRRRILATVFAALMLSSCAKNTARAVDMPGIRYEYSKNVTEEVMQSKGDDLLIECVYGSVLDEEGNGEVINLDNPDHNYISYRNLMSVLEKGDTVRTLLFYDVGNDAPDAIFGRIDYKITGGESQLVSVWFDQIEEIIR